ncbi:ABC transporter ATP-binding protein [Silicimonas algicola]|uniref:ABC transporter ATP-binding protein n=1 Tax=Silicimonas algicola TaxID=1826607 RepID=UPI001F499CC4|nr:oligopeptide/dipeptide ABC transporter ATP-binding protein [Silicimonas algicola]
MKVQEKAQPLLKVTDLAVRFGEVRAVDGVSFTIAPGETLGLVGESGSGKSTVGRAILQLVRSSGGTVELDGTDLGALNGERLRTMRRKMQVVFQDPRGSLDPRMRISAILAEPLVIHGLRDKTAMADRVRDLMRLVGLHDDMADRFPHQISGGQAQRVAIGRALALEPALIVADEPVSSLDVSIQAQVMNLLADLRASLGLSMLFIAHDLAVVRHISDRIAVMYLGQIVELAPRDRIYAKPLHPYTRSLLSAVPVPDPARERARKRIILEGDPPSPDNPPPGCPLSSRCALRRELGDPAECEKRRPALTETALGHHVACHFARE